MASGNLSDPVAALAAGRLRDRIRKNTHLAMDVFKDAASDAPGSESSETQESSDRLEDAVDILNLRPAKMRSAQVEKKKPRTRARSRSQPASVKERDDPGEEVPEEASAAKHESHAHDITITLPDVDSVLPEHAETALEAAHRVLESYAKKIQFRRGQGNVLQCHTCKVVLADHSKAMMRMVSRDAVTGIYGEYLWCSENCYIIDRMNHKELFEPHDTSGAHLSNRDR